MNYRHLYHAGNFADVFKHILLVLLIESLLRKDKPFCYLDTHAGIGLYDLFSPASQKTREYEHGIAKLLSSKEFPAELTHYLSAIRAVNPQAITENLHYYPGSPAIVRHLLRSNDRMILIELHPDEWQFLKQEFIGDKQVAVHYQDGYQALKAFLPPPERRGLVFIDPPFEQPDEFSHMVASLITAYKRWPTGIYAMWYPLKNLSQVKQFYLSLQRSALPEILKLEFAIYPEDSPLGLNGCGMIVINPPYQFAEQSSKILQWLWQVLAPQKQGGFKVEWLKE